VSERTASIFRGLRAGAGVASGVEESSTSSLTGSPAVKTPLTDGASRFPA